MSPTRSLSRFFDYLDAPPSARSLSIALIATCATLLYWAATTVPLECAGLGDCVKYLDMAQAFRNRTFHPIESPFNLRILAPLVASVLARDPSQGFALLNSLSILVFTSCWYGITKKLRLGNLAFFSLLIWFFIHPIGFRLYFVIPAMTDPASYAFIALITWLFLSARWPALYVSLFLALLTKESFSFIAFIVLAATAIRMAVERDFKQGRRVLIGVLCVLLAYAIAKHAMSVWLFPHTGQFAASTSGTIRYWAGQVRAEPARLIVWLGAILCATGTFLATLASRRMTANHRASLGMLAYFALGSAGFIALGILAGSDMSRIIFNGNMLTITLCLIAVKEGQWPPSYLLAHLLASMAIALNYTRFMTSTIEYDYYTQNHRVLPTMLFIATTLVAILVVEAAFHFRHAGHRTSLAPPSPTT